MRYSAFVFESYRYDPANSALALRYRFADGPRFEEALIFELPPRPLSPADKAALDRICRLIFLLAGVSYYKAYVPPSLLCEAFPLDRQTAAFLQSFYENGLAEFAWKNRISLRGHCRFRAEPIAPPAPIALELPRRSCVPVGGGKDSVVTIECLKAAGEDLVLFALGDAQPIAACIAAAGLPYIRVRRRLDPGLLKLNEGGALNGHVPITGILSAIVLACAVLGGFDAIVMSNEHSASAPNLSVGGAEINHQFSKSLEFERAIRRLHRKPHLAEHRLFFAAAAVVGDRDRPAFRSLPAIFRAFPQLQHRVPAVAGRARPALVRRLPEMPVRVPGLGALCRQAAS